ncbi:MAG: fluoride efflux transporter CrcB [Bacteroidota bacterium]
MMNALAIFVGGGLGSLARWGLSRWFNSSFSGFFLGTFLANFLACIVLGFFAGLLLGKTTLSDPAKLGVMVGFCGGFSTFSTFSNETFGLFESGKPGWALLYIGVSVVLCLFGIWLGMLMGKGLG